MNEVLQRRLVGALVLLVLAFVLAALLPDARTPYQSGGAPVVTYDLSTGMLLDESPAAAEESGVNEETPAPSALAQGETETPDVPAPETPAEIQPQESQAPVPSESWFVQVGSFENEANARAVLVKLYQLKMPTAIQSVRVGKALWFRVRVGPYPAEEPAQKALGTIRRQGYDGARLMRPEVQ